MENSGVPSKFYMQQENKDLRDYISGPTLDRTLTIIPRRKEGLSSGSWRTWAYIWDWMGFPPMEPEGLAGKLPATRVTI